MKGLMLKEYYSLKPYVWIYLVYILIFGAITVMTGQGSFLASMMGVMVFSMPISSFSVDEQTHWDRMALATPASRNQIVLSKFLLLLVCAVSSLLVQVPIVIVNQLMGRSEDILGLVMSSTSAVVVLMVGMAIVMPFIFKVGSEKGRLIMMLFFGLGFGVAMMGIVLLEFGGGFAMEETLSAALVVLAVELAVAVVSLLLSYKLSCKIYNKREW